MALASARHRPTAGLRSFQLRPTLTQLGQPKRGPTLRSLRPYQVTCPSGTSTSTFSSQARYFLAPIRSKSESHLPLRVILRASVFPVLRSLSTAQVSAHLRTRVMFRQFPR